MRTHTITERRISRHANAFKACSTPMRAQGQQPAVQPHAPLFWAELLARHKVRARDQRCGRVRGSQRRDALGEVVAVVHAVEALGNRLVVGRERWRPLAPMEVAHDQIDRRDAVPADEVRLRVLRSPRARCEHACTLATRREKQAGESETSGRAHPGRMVP